MMSSHNSLRRQRKRAILAEEGRRSSPHGRVNRFTLDAAVPAGELRRADAVKMIRGELKTTKKVPAM